MSKIIKVIIPADCPELFMTSLRIVVIEAMQRYGVQGMVEIELENTMLLHEAPIYNAASIGSAARAAEALHIPLEEPVSQSQR